MGHFGFSYVGLVCLLALFIPNLFWTKNKPKDYVPSGENRVLLAFERVGQAWVTCVALVFRDFNWHPWTAWSWWLVGAVALMSLYEVWWFRYFRSEKTMRDFTAGLLGVPVAGATLPVLAFFLLGIYGKVIWMVLGVVILGIGHIGIHLQHRREAAIKQGGTNNE